MLCILLIYTKFLPITQFLLVILFLNVSVTVLADTWCYEGSCGPKNWKGKCKFGTSQSPVNIEPTKLQKSKPGRKLFFSKEYYQTHQFEIINNGHTVMLSLPSNGDGSRSVSQLRVEGAGWNGQYAFLQMHLHWGSEHLIKGKRYPLELHIVHEQVNGNGGLGVLGIIYGISTSDSKPLAPIVEMLQNVKTTSENPILMQQSLNLSIFFPDVFDVFRYTGSLTTPPCSESILWSVFTRRMPVSKIQVSAFRQLQDGNGKTINDNFRPVKPVKTKTRKTVYWMPVNKNKMIASAF